jgi:DNA-directed RNA polymerase specialized sigma24 family protein
VVNRIRDELRRVKRRHAVPLNDDMACRAAGPLELAVRNERYERYRAAVAELRAKDRELVIAHVEAQWSLTEIVERFAYKTTGSARMAVTRALQRLANALR